MQDNFRPIQLQHERVITFRSDNVQPLDHQEWSTSGHYPNAQSQQEDAIHNDKMRPMKNHNVMPSYNYKLKDQKFFFYQSFLSIRSFF